MQVHDPLYGRFEIPSYLDDLISSPEVRRLSSIRLINALSPSLATLGEIRRYSHTLGVLYLSTHLPLLGYGEDTVKAFQAAVLLHDIGTPPFGHLLEYHLRDRSNWNHETVIPSILTGNVSPENVAHQIFGGRTGHFLELCRMKKIRDDIVLSIVRKEHSLSSLIFGSMDIDNLDNVMRMAWALGISPNTSHVINIAKNLSVDLYGNMILPSTCAQSVEVWMNTRKDVYNILVYDSRTVAAQAVLSRALKLSFDENELSELDWDKHDEELIAFLSRSRSSKSMLIKHYLGKLPNMTACFYIHGVPNDFGFDGRASIEGWFDDLLIKKLGINDALCYVFIDKGAFGKRVTFRDPTMQTEWSTGTNSNGIVLYAFNTQKRRAKLGTSGALEKAVQDRFQDRAKSMKFIA